MIKKKKKDHYDFYAYKIEKIRDGLEVYSEFWTINFRWNIHRVPELTSHFNY